MQYTLEYCACVCENFVQIGPVVFILLHQDSNYSVIYDNFWKEKKIS